MSVAIRRARHRARAAGADVRFVQADIARIAPQQLGDDYALLQDLGCFAGLSDEDRRRAAATMTDVAASGAALLMFAFGRGGGSRFGPRRVELPEIRELFPGWDIEFSRPADEVELKGPMRDAPHYWHQLVKR